jgi:hypothetical protein
MPVVLRVETEDGQGCYRNPEVVTVLNHTDVSTHPEPHALHEPWYDLRYMWNTINQYCGFIDMIQFRAWFSEEDCEILRQHGCYLTLYEVAEEHILLGDKQITFEKSKATRKALLVVSRDHII